MSSLSIAMIVKNEAEHLSACLDSAKLLADEICVIDTGSSDNTLELARAYGCKTDVFPWQHDFSAARNASLALCAKPWIFVLDADERIDGLGIAQIRSLIQREDEACYRFCTRNYDNNRGLVGFAACAPDDPHAQGFSGWHPSWKIRLFPNRPDIRFSGAVHELVNPSVEALGMPIFTVDAPIHHYPLRRLPERIAEKRQLYLTLGKTKVADNPLDDKAHAELGAQYAELGHWTEAVRAYSDAVRLAPNNADHLAELGSVLHLAGHAAQARAALELAVKLAPQTVKAWRNLGVVLASNNLWEQARHCFSTALTLSPDDPDLRQCLDAALERLPH